MTDYRHEIQFGYFLSPDADDPEVDAAPAPAGDSDTAIVGPPEHWVDVLTHLARDLGFSTFLLAAPPDPEALRKLIEDVAPQVRERVEAGRAAG